MKTKKTKADNFVNDLECIEFEYENENWYITSNEDLWLVPVLFMQSEEYESWII